MEHKKQIVVFGGCFNPPLYSHFSLAEQIINEYQEIEKLLFVPVSRNYQKEGLIGNEYRYDMLKLVCDKHDIFEVSRIELDSDRQLYTVETLEKIQELYPNHEIRFIMGSDNLKELHWWNGAERLLKKFKIYILQRDHDDVAQIIESNKFLKQHKDSLIQTNNTIISDLSSTFARELIKNGKSIRYITTPEIIEYIKENQLYQ